MGIKADYLMKLMEGFSTSEKIIVLCDIADIDTRNAYSNLDRLSTFRKLVKITEGVDDEFGKTISDFSYDRYRQLRKSIGSDAMRSVRVIGEDEEEKSRDTKEREEKKRKEENEEETELKNKEGKKKEQAPLAKALRSKGEDQEEAANKLDVDPSTISRIKTGVRRPSFELMQKMAKTYGRGLVDQLVSSPSS